MSDEDYRLLSSAVAKLQNKADPGSRVSMTKFLLDCPKARADDIVGK